MLFPLTVHMEQFWNVRFIVSSINCTSDKWAKFDGAIRI